MTEQRLAFLEVDVFTYLSIYVQYVRVHVQVQYAFVEWVMTAAEAGIYTKHNFSSKWQTFLQRWL